MKNGIQELGDMVKGNCTHYWIIGSNNVGHCKYCPEVRDFGELLRREGQLSGPKSKRGGSKGKRGRKKKEELL